MERHDHENPLRRALGALVLAALIALGTTAAPTTASARESGFQVSELEDYAMVSKDVNGERWAMTYDLFDGTITGNVFPTDGGAPKFVVCEVLDEDAAGNITADCKGADACTSCPCTKGWTAIGEVTLPGTFFELCN
ncbi:MAG: hypothetical protein ACKO2K_13725 [Alphaproteobacteria bacterium]